MESNWRLGVFEKYGSDTGFQLLASIRTHPSGRWLLKESDTLATVRNASGPGPDGFGTILQTITVTAAMRFPYGFLVVGD